MVRLALCAALVATAATVPAMAQPVKLTQPNSCEKFSEATPAGADRNILYLRAACVAARAGVTSPANGPLDREELMSILMLMGLEQETRTGNAS